MVAPHCLGEIYLCNSREGRVGDLSVLCFRSAVVYTVRTGEMRMVLLGTNDGSPSGLQRCSGSVHGIVVVI